MGFIDDMRDTFDVETDSLTHTPELNFDAAPDSLSNEGPPGGGSEPSIGDYTVSDAPTRSESVAAIPSVFPALGEEAGERVKDMLPWEIKGLGALVAVLAVLYIVGQAFTFNVGGGS